MVKNGIFLLTKVSQHCLEEYHDVHLLFKLFSTEKKLIKHERVCNDHDYCYVEMPDEDNKISKQNYREKSLKAPFMIYADLECLLEKMHLSKQ